MSISDYQGRTVDLLAYPGATATGDTQLGQSLIGPGDGGHVCTGIQKLAQRFLIEFLTIKGSMFYRPLRGCNFMLQLLQGQLRTTLDVQAAFSTAMFDVYTNLKSEETSSDQTDEQFAGAELISTTLTQGSVTLRIAVYSVAGASRKVILPIPVTLGRIS